MSTAEEAQRLLFVGSYGPSDEPTIHVCTLDDAGSDLRVVSTASGIRNPSFVTVSSDGRHLYAVSETGRASDGAPGAVHAFDIDDGPDALELAPMNHQSSEGDHPCHLRIDPTGRWLAVSNYGNGSVAVLPIRSDGSLGEPTAVVQHEGSGPNLDRQEGPHAHATIFSPDGRFLIAADLGTDRLVVSAFDAETGLVRPHGKTIASPGAGPRHLAFHPDGSRLLVVNELDNTLTLHRWDAESGALRELVTVSTLPADAPESIAADIRITPDGRRVFVSNRGHDSVAVFAVEAQTLTRLAVRSCGGSWPRGLGLAPTGDRLLVANERSDEVVVLPLHDGDSGLGEPLAHLRVPRPTCLAFATGSRPNRAVDQLV